MFQSFNLIPHLSVLENVTIAMQMTAKSERERNKRAEEILTEVGLANQMNKNQISFQVVKNNELRLPVP